MKDRFHPSMFPAVKTITDIKPRIIPSFSPSHDGSWIDRWEHGSGIRPRDLIASNSPDYPYGKSPDVPKNPIKNRFHPSLFPSG